MNQGVELATAADLPEIFAIFEKTFPGHPRLRDAEYFGWQYLANSDGEYSFLLFRREGRVAGFLGYVPVEVRFADRMEKGVFLQHWYSRDRDGSGIVLMGTAASRAPVRMMCDISEEAQRIYRAQRIPSVDTVPRWIGVIDLPGFVDLLGEVDVTERETLARSAQELARSAGRVPIVPRLEPGEELSLAHFPDVHAHVRRDEPLMRWRYVDIPRHDYRILRATDGQFAVYRIEPVLGTKHHVARIVEWTVGPRNAAETLSTILAEATARGAVLVDFFCTARAVGRTLEDLGFVAAETLGIQVPRLFQPLHHAPGIRLAIDARVKGAPAPDIGSWYVTKGDSDMDRVKL